MPFGRLLLPLIIGICWQNFFPPSIYVIGLFLLFGLLSFCSYSLIHAPYWKFRWQYLPGIGLFLVVIGMGAAITQLQTSYETEKNPQLFPYATAVINETPLQNERSVKCPVSIISFIDSSRLVYKSGAKAILYIKPDEKSTSLIPGNILIFKQQLKPIQNYLNPEGFDYSSYLKRKGIIFSQYIKDNDWERIGYQNPVTLREKALKIRSELLVSLQNKGFGQEELAILNSLLLGHTSDLTHKQRTHFSTAGLSHILAVSGLHTGIILSLIYLLLFPLYYMRLQSAKTALALIALWAYAYITGLSPSVVRACIMATCILGASMFGRKNTTANSLFVAAFFMLLYNPDNLFGISFQLSFLAVFSIVCFYPYINGLFLPKNRILTYLWSVLSISAAAQLGTIPVVIYYFHEFPLLFFLTNLLVLPLLPILLGAGLLLIVLIYSHILPWEWLAIGLNRALSYLNGFTEWIASLEFASIKNIGFLPLHLLGYFILAILLLQIIKTHRSRYFIYLLVFFTGFLCLDIFIRQTTPRVEKTAIIYQNSSSAALNLIGHNLNLLIPLDSTMDISSIERTAGNYWIKKRLPSPSLVEKDSITERFFIQHPYIQYGNSRFILVNSNRWRHKINGQKLVTDYLIIGKGFNGGMTDICNLFTFRQVIIAPNVDSFISYRLRRSCVKRGISCYSVKKQGAWIKPLAGNEPDKRSASSKTTADSLFFD